MYCQFRTTSSTCILVILLSLVGSYSTLSSQTTLNVPSDYGTIQEALVKATEGTTILVAPGTYFENLYWPVTIDGVQLRSTGGSEETIIDGGGNGRVIQMEVNYNSNFFISPATVIDGFTLQNGDSNLGGGIALRVIGANPTLENLIIRNNHCNGSGSNGCAVLLSNFSGSISNCTFANNSINDSASGNGAGLYLEPSNTVKIENCKFENNIASSSDKSFGGAMYIKPSIYTNQPAANIELNHCDFVDNSVQSTVSAYGGAFYCADFFQSLVIEVESCTFDGNSSSNTSYSYGGAIHAVSTGLTFNNTSFTDNVAVAGSAVYIGNNWNNFNGVLNFSNVTVSNNQGYSSDFESSSAMYIGTSFSDPRFENCLIHHNPVAHTIRSASGEEDSELLIANSTLAFNDGPLYLSTNNVSIYNTILWNKSATEINIANHSPPSSLDIHSCVVRGGADGTHVIDADPLFTSEYLLTPSAASPCLSHGTITNSPDTDILGNPRPLPAGSSPDIGAYEIDQYFANVQVRFYSDENQNGIIDNGERYLSAGSVMVDGDQVYHNSREEGIYVVLEQGTAQIAYSNSNLPDWKTTSVPSYSFDVDNLDFSESIEFGLSPSVYNPSISAFNEGDPLRCGEEVAMEYHLINFGTETESGIAWLALDPRIDQVVYDVTADTVQSSHVVGWFFDGLYPFESIDISYTVTAPLIDSADQVGEIYTFKSWTDNQDPRQAFCYDTELRCSYDPNDKAVSPNRPDSLALLDDYLLYKIRFQNTGNDYARNVSVLDTIDSNLDLSTFKLINTSHPEVLKVIMSEDNQVEFNFRNIFLPDSLTDLSGSNGHITYLIKPIEGLDELTPIENTAHIYFDFNPAIVTNTTSNILVEAYPENFNGSQPRHSVTI